MEHSNSPANNYAKVRKEQLKLEKEQMDRKIVADTLYFNRECRRTAMQLASRKGNDDVKFVIQDAEAFYKWLIDVK